MEANHKRESNIKVAIFLNVLFTIIELIGGIWTNSLTIMSDALHDFGDSVTLTTAWIAEKTAQKKPDTRRTFGYQRISLFSALLSAIVLVTGSLFILSRAVPRLMNPEHVNVTGMALLAIIGITFNGIAVLRLKKGQDLNERVLTWHMLEDVLGWCVILTGSIIMFFWDNHLIDPIMTVGFTLFILWGVVKNLKETINIFLQGVPSHININHIRDSLLSYEGIKRIHDVHVWSLEGETDVFTGHIVVDDSLLKSPDETRRIIKNELNKHHIEHSTIELESEGFCSGIECND